MYSKILQKQRLANEIKICSSYIYCALNATSKFNFKPLFDIIKIFKEYLKQSIQNSLNKRMFFIPPFPQQLGEIKPFAILWINTSTLELPTIATGVIWIHIHREIMSLLTLGRCKYSDPQNPFNDLEI